MLPDRRLRVGLLPDVSSREGLSPDALWGDGLPRMGLLRDEALGFALTVEGLSHSAWASQAANKPPAPFAAFGIRLMIFRLSDFGGAKGRDEPVSSGA
jgi:hypothetical protein